MSEFSGLFTPGELITEDPSWMRGHGTYVGADKLTYASVAGRLERVNRLLRVRPLHGRYDPQIGDHIVGRVTEVGNRKWKVELGAAQDAVLQLGSVNLPGGVLRRKSDDDELNMRDFLKEGDLLNAEVQMLYSDGGCALHTRSLRYGKLRNGMLCRVPAQLVLQQLSQSHLLEGGVEVIMGANGYVWLRQAAAPARTVAVNRLEQESDAKQIYRDANDDVPLAVRQTIARYANCVHALADCGLKVYGERLQQVYEASLAHADAADLLRDDVKRAICGV